MGFYNSEIVIKTIKEDVQLKLNPNEGETCKT